MILAAAVFYSGPGTKNECWCLRSILSLDRRAVAERGALLSTQSDKLTRSLVRQRQKQTQCQIEFENPDRDGVLRHVTGTLGGDSEPIQVLACPQGPSSAATWQHVECGRLRLFSVDQTLSRTIHVERASP